MNLVYDLGKYPASWDFLQWLMNAEIIRRATNSPALGVVFVPGPKDGFRDDNLPRPIEQRRLIFQNVMRPALELVAATEELASNTDKVVTYVMRPTIEWDRKGGTVPMYRVPEQYLAQAKLYLGERWPVVITLREASYYPARNSNLSAWMAFARECGEDVIFVRDTAKADEPLGDFETCPRASKELLFRAALMAHAKCNLMVATGVWNLALYSRVPWLNFGTYRPDLPDYRPGSAEWCEKKLGVPVGSQVPWSAPNQRLVWKENADSLENIKEAWEQVASSFRRRQRRKITREFEKHFDMIREQTNKYGDALLRIDTIEMYEGINDKPADMLVACDILEHLAEPMTAVNEMNRLAMKTLLFLIRPDAIRTEGWWKKKLNNVVTVTSWLCENGMITCVAQAGMKLQGVTVVGAMTMDDRWSHLEHSMAKFSKRIKGMAAHDRTAVLACYGPSLEEYLPKLQEVVAETKGTLVSVSGAHDFLIKHDTVPDIHVECDPRPHKTDNINIPDKRVNYLIASSCHPSYFDKLDGCDVTLWHVSESSHNMKLVDKLKEPVDTIVSGGGSVGLRAIPLLYHLGYRKFEIFGMDCSFADDGEKQWAGPHAGKRQVIDDCKCGDRIFKTSAQLMAYSTQFFDIMKRLPDAEFCVWGDGLLPAMCRLYWKHPQLKQKEEAANAA